jgi:uncharacterized protein YegP (UPF0339 family)
MKIVISKKGWFRQKWSFQIVARNGNILCSSEKYWNKQDCLDTVYLIQNHSEGCKVEYKYPEK